MHIWPLFVFIFWSIVCSADADDQILRWESCFSFQGITTPPNQAGLFMRQAEAHTCHRILSLWRDVSSRIGWKFGYRVSAIIS